MSHDDFRPLRARTKWAGELEEYLRDQRSTDLRETEIPDFPWPAYDNPMVGYLHDATMELLETETLESALAWLTAHAWYEGAIEAITEQRRSDDVGYEGD